jgi:hypothetical protein
MMGEEGRLYCWELDTHNDNDDDGGGGRGVWGMCVPASIMVVVIDGGGTIAPGGGDGCWKGM